METINLKGQATTAAKLRRALERIIQLYTDKSHFLYELLQNAEDTKATSAKFVQYEDRLEFFHDGHPFTQSNFDSLCDVGNSDKIKELNQIGEFGVGFKSVFSICKSVKLYSQPSHHKDKTPGFLEKFAVEIEDFTQPKLIPFEDFEAPFTTRFVFPFAVGLSFSGFETFEDLKRKLSTKLQGLAPSTLLFMKNLRSIEYQINTKELTAGGRYTLSVEKLSERCTRVTACGHANSRGNEKEAEETDYLVFSKPIDNKVQGGGDFRTVDIAFLITKDNECISKEQYVSVYFPTETESKLNFIVQGPFRTTPNRTSIPADNKENIALASKVSELLRESLIELQEMRRLNLSYLSALPLDENKFENYDLFKPLYDEVFSLFNSLERPMIPTRSHDYVTREFAKLARSEKLVELFSDYLLSELIEVTPQQIRYKWLSTDITETNQRNRHIYDYITKKLKVRTIRPDDLKNYLDKNPSFLPSRTDEWLVRFYNLLATEWRAECDRNKESNILTTKFVLTSDGEFNAPYKKERDNEGNIQYIQALFPPVNTSGKFDYMCIDKGIYNECTDFFKNILRLQGLDDRRIKIESIKERYSRNYVFSEESHIEDVLFLLNKEDSFDKKQNIKDVFLLRCSDGRMRCAESEKIYLPKDGDINIEAYLRNVAHDVHFLDSYFYSSHNIDLASLEFFGVKTSLITGTDDHSGTYITEHRGTNPRWESQPQSFCWLLNIEYIFPVLDYIRTHPLEFNSRQKSRAIMATISRYRDAMSGFVEISSRKYDKPFKHSLIIYILKGEFDKVYEMRRALHVEGISDVCCTGSSCYVLIEDKSNNLGYPSYVRVAHFDWLYTNSGKWVSPREITKSDLDINVYGEPKESEIYNLLGFKKAPSDLLQDFMERSNKQERDAFFISEFQRRYGCLPDEVQRMIKKNARVQIDEGGEDEEFPCARVKNWLLLKKHVAEELVCASPVEYKYLVRHIRTSKNYAIVKEYLRNMYASRGGKTCACQMCHQFYDSRCSEQLFNLAEVELSSMNLNLCPKCAREYKALRSDDGVMQRFRQNILDLSKEDIGSSDPVSISLQDHDIWFTQIHIAEIRESLRLQREKKENDEEMTSLD